VRFIKVKDEERTGEVAINLDLVREAHSEGDCCTSISSAAPPHKMT